MGQITNQTIADFYRQAQKVGFARDFQFKVVAFRVNGIELGPRDLVFLKTASLPGKTINTVTANFMGVDFQIPGTVKYDNNNNWQVTFYCTQDYHVRKLLESSMSDTFNIRTSTGNMEPRDPTLNVIKLSLVDDQLNEIRTYILHGAFVTGVGDMGFDATKDGGVQEVSATIAYQYWTTAPSSDISEIEDVINIAESLLG